MLALVVKFLAIYRRPNFVSLDHVSLEHSHTWFGVDSSVLDLISWFKLQNSSTNGPVALYPSILNAALSALLGHIRIAPLEQSICICYGKGVDYRLVLYYFNGFKVIYKYGECKFLKYCIL